MPKNKLKTPDWIMQGYDSEADYNKAKGMDKKKSCKIFKIRKCPECGSDNVGVVIGSEQREWECRKCKWKGTDVQKQELNEEEFMKYLDEIAPKGVPPHSVPGTRTSDTQKGINEVPSMRGDINIEGKEKKQEDKDKPVKPDDWIEKTHLRAFAAAEAVDKAFTIFDIYKKSHGMVSFT